MGTAKHPCVVWRGHSRTGRAGLPAAGGPAGVRGRAPAGGKQVELPNLRARTIAANALGNGNGNGNSTLRGAAEGQGFASN